MPERTQVRFGVGASEFIAEEGWSQAELARRLDLDPAFLSKALRGKDYKSFSPDLIARISELAGLPHDYFPEVREAAVVELVRSRPGLRDHLYDQYVLEP